MAIRANAVLHVVSLSSRNEVDNLRDLPRSVCSDASLDRVRAVLTGDGLDPETGVSIRVTEVGQGRAELSAQRVSATDTVRAWVCWEAGKAERYWTEISTPHAGDNHDPMRWLSENVSVPWLAIRPGTADRSATSAGAPEPGMDLYRLLEATAWVLIEQSASVLAGQGGLNQ